MLGNDQTVELEYFLITSWNIRSYRLEVEVIIGGQYEGRVRDL